MRLMDWCSGCLVKKKKKPDVRVGVTSTEWRLFSYIASVLPWWCPCWEKSIRALLTQHSLLSGGTEHHQRDGEGEKRGERGREKAGKRKITDWCYSAVQQLSSLCLLRAACSGFVGQQKVRRSLLLQFTGGVSVGQMINCALALKAVNFRAINSDEPLKQIADPCEKVKGKDTYLCSASCRIPSLPFVCSFLSFFLSWGVLQLILTHFDVFLYVMQMTGLFLSFAIITFWRSCRRLLFKVSHRSHAAHFGRWNWHEDERDGVGIKLERPLISGGLERAELQRDAGTADPTTPPPQTAGDVPGESCTVHFSPQFNHVPVGSILRNIWSTFLNAPAVKMMHRLHYFPFDVVSKAEEMRWGECKLRRCFPRCLHLTAHLAFLTSAPASLQSVRCAGGDARASTVVTKIP